MKTISTLSSFATVLALGLASVPAAQSQPRAHAIEGALRLDLRGVVAEPREHLGNKAVRIVAAPGADGETIAIVPDTDFGDGTIELELSGGVLAGAPDGARGFVGVAFRVDPKTLAYDCFYLRPTNGRSLDQLRRNHSTQYVSHPDFPWHRLRKEQPGVYESYVDLEPGVWTRVRVVVTGGQALLHVNGATQPTLVVTDMKRSPARGAIALWIGDGTEAFFRNLTVTPAR
jgi:hypothetical protein